MDNAITTIAQTHSRMLLGVRASHARKSFVNVSELLEHRSRILFRQAFGDASHPLARKSKFQLYPYEMIATIENLDFSSQSKFQLTLRI